MFIPVSYLPVTVSASTGDKLYALWLVDKPVLYAVAVIGTVQTSVVRLWVSLRLEHKFHVGSEVFHEGGNVCDTLGRETTDKRRNERTRHRH